jgi:hypothetical protein
MGNLETYKKGILEGRTIDDIEREIKFQSEAQRITRIEEQLSTKIVKVDYLKNSANIIFPENIIDAIELNNRRIEWIEEKNKKPSKRGTRPGYIKDVNRFIDDVNNISSNYVYDMMDVATTHALSQKLQYLFDMFLCSDKYDEIVEVNI